MRHKLIGYIFKMAAQYPKLASDSLEKIPDNIAVSFLPDFESLSKKALEKGLNYFTQGYIHNIKISEARGCKMLAINEKKSRSTQPSCRNRRWQTFRIVLYL